MSYGLSGARIEPARSQELDGSPGRSYYPSG